MNTEDPVSDQIYAAIDLGSNSFHMMIAEAEGNSIRQIDSLRMPTRLGAGLDKNKRLTPETEAAALDALAQFAERLRNVPRKHIRMVGTNTLRRARNTDNFMREANRLLGKPIEIISGREEARLIYFAVSHTFPGNNNQRLVIDIGGGSTELIIGRGIAPSLMESVNMGCVSYSTLYLNNDDKLTSANFKRAMMEAELELQPLIVAYQHAGWDEVIGCSGTIKAAANMLAELRLSDGTITQESLDKLTRRAIKAGSVQALNLRSISTNRAQVIAGGLAILLATMRTLDISSIKASQVALREGLVFDMLGKAEHADIQSQTLANLSNRYSIDIRQSSRVEKTATQLFELAAEPWKLDRETDRELLIWAARLHELGMVIAHTQYHKHGAYILENSDLLGFSLAEQKALSLLVRYHRRKIDKEAFSTLPDEERQRLLRLLGLLRLAALLHRGRHDEPLDDINLRIKDGQITVIAPQRWLDEHPLTWAELLAEAERLTHVNIRLKAEKSA
ncbi:Ppx/GppA phosphatase family protein [Granulosicoccus antarcticus]|uniref:Exopolyphosphatase n=1 Tax=Granulosicoccus antarcticus IMCC3135 TaxID=1192854 RepID=A0A2Z2NLM2_9GAMM|nr:Ppx/GppA phosphatase family protein [Granulosicoccus antarcticus]ASJ72226.1 Exopolyphosphatase [Granulosicoccus antarcticus IMCC3135]